MRVVSLSLVLLGGAALAQEDDLSDLPDGVDVIPEVQHVLFDPLAIDAEVTRPDGSFHLEVPPQRFNPLLTMRTDFDREIAASVDETR